MPRHGLSIYISLERGYVALLVYEGIRDKVGNAKFKLFLSYQGRNNRYSQCFLIYFSQPYAKTVYKR